jgi:4-carboxymuconolactone decarboxylase
MTEPRLGPLAESDWTPEVRRQLEKLRDSSSGVVDLTQLPNIFTTLVRHPRLFGDWMRFGGRLLQGRELPGRDSELLILRTAWRTGSDYEWSQHRLIALRFGLTAEEVERVAHEDLDGWAEDDAVLLRACDQLFESNELPDATWAALAGRYDEHQLIEVLMTVGHYTLLAWTLRTLRVPLDPGLVGLPQA